jgi:AcrR family transcriptional regulator
MRVAKENHKTDERRAAVLIAARRAFAELGSAGFSMRAVAKTLDMSLSHLQYFFPTKDSLFLEIVRQTVRDYEYNYQRFIIEQDESAEAQLSATLDYLLNDIMQLDVTAMFIELWSIALRDKKARIFQRRMYVTYRRSFSPIVARQYPNASRADIKRTTTQILAHIDGMMVLYMVAWPKGKSLLQIRHDAKTFMLNIMNMLRLEENPVLEQAPQPMSSK